MQPADSSLIAEKLAIKMADNEIPVMMICGMYQLFGHYLKMLIKNKA